MFLECFWIVLGLYSWSWVVLGFFWMILVPDRSRLAWYIKVGGGQFWFVFVFLMIVNESVIVKNTSTKNNYRLVQICVSESMTSENNPGTSGNTPLQSITNTENNPGTFQNVRLIWVCMNFASIYVKINVSCPQDWYVFEKVRLYADYCQFGTSYTSPFTQQKSDSSRQDSRELHRSSGSHFLLPRVPQNLPGACFDCSGCCGCILCLLNSKTYSQFEGTRLQATAKPRLRSQSEKGASQWQGRSLNTWCHVNVYMQ